MERHQPGRLAQTILKDLRSDVHSGATDIARKAVQCLNAFSEEGHDSSATYWKDLVGLGKAMIASQPSMASLFNLVNQVLLKVEPLRQQSKVEMLKTATREGATQFMRTSDAALENIAQHGQGLITPNSTVFTHSSSNTVGGILRQAIHQAILEIEVPGTGRERLRQRDAVDLIVDDAVVAVDVHHAVCASNRSRQLNEHLGKAIIVWEPSEICGIERNVAAASADRQGADNGDLSDLTQTFEREMDRCAVAAEIYAKAGAQIALAGFDVVTSKRERRKGEPARCIGRRSHDEVVSRRRDGDARRGSSALRHAARQEGARGGRRRR